MYSLTLASSAVCALAFSGIVSAHGFVSSVAIGGTKYPGANGPSASSSSPMRQVASGDPVQDLTSQDLVCGKSAQLASSSATGKPGDLMQFWWVGEGGGNWFHTAGPIENYMALCDGPCSSYTPSSSTNWFKISEFGEKVNGQPGTWVQADLNSGAPANVTLPSNLANGEYLVRHEIIAVQNAQSVGGVELYPSCLQITISGGSQSATPSPTVKFPGEYTPQDPGLLGNFYNPGTLYTFPGGPVSNIKDPLSDTNDAVSGAVSVTPVAGASSAPANVNATPTPASPASATSAASANPSSGSGKQCRIKKRAVNQTSFDAIKRSGISAHKKRRLTTSH